MSAICTGLDETIARVREQRSIAAFACHTLARSLRTGADADGLQAVTHICATVLMTDELVDFIARADAPESALAEARCVRRSMLSEVAPWLAAAVRDLRGADAVVHRFYLACRSDGPGEE